MGYGDYPFGSGPFGYDPVANPTSRATSTEPFPLFDPYTQGYPFDPSGGELISVHPVMQSAALSLGIALGSVPAVPGLGINVKRIRKARAADVPQVFTDEVGVCLAHLTTAGLIEIVKAVATASNGTVTGQVELRNLADPTASTATFPVRF